MVLKKGILIAIEGIDGSGKSTLAKGLTSRLLQEQIPVILTREPGGTPLGAYLRKMLQARRDVSICPKAEYLLFAADRAQHVEEVINDALEKNMVVISDRMGDSSIAYQGFGRGVDIDMIQTINQWALGGRLPDITIYLRVDSSTALKRRMERNSTPTDFEGEEAKFLERVIQGFDSIMKNKEGAIIIDGMQSIDQVVLDAYNQVCELL